MSGSDSYILAKSLEPQSLTDDSPFESETWNYIPDLNSGIYQSQGLSLVQFDLSSIYSSSALVSLQEAYLAIPLTMVTQGLTSGGLGVFQSSNALTSGAGFGMWQWAGLKPGFLNLLHAAEFAVNSQQVEQYQPYNNIYSYAKWCSMASQDDQNVFCESLGFGRTALDNPLSYKYNGPASATTAGSTYASYTTTLAQAGLWGGNGLTNCAPYPTGGSTLNASGLPNSGDQSSAGVQVNPSVYNNNYYYRLNTAIDTNTGNNLTGSSALGGDLYGPNAISTSNNISIETRVNFSIQNTATNSFGVTQQVAIIRLCDILDSCKNIPLAKRISGTLRLYFNTGACWVNGIGANTGAVGGATALFSGANTSFTNTCPLMISQLLNTNANVNAQPYTGATAVNGATPAYVQSISSALFIGKCTGTTIGGFTFPALASNLIPSCRLYYPQVKLKTEKMKLYLDMGLNKKVCYAPYLFNFYQNIGAGAQFSQLLQSGIRRPKGIMVLPYISASVNGTVSNVSGIVPFSPLLSPFDPAPTSTGPISLVNLQVALGGQNQIQNIVQSSWEQFIEYTSNYNKLNGIDLGIKCGVFNQFTFENFFRMYYIDLSRSTLAEAMTTRNLTISFTNNSNVAIDTYMFTEYYDEFEINVENGLITK